MFQHHIHLDNLKYFLIKKIWGKNFFHKKEIRFSLVWKASTLGKEKNKNLESSLSNGYVWRTYCESLALKNVKSCLSLRPRKLKHKRRKLEARQSVWCLNITIWYVCQLLNANWVWSQKPPMLCLHFLHIIFFNSDGFMVTISSFCTSWMYMPLWIINEGSQAVFRCWQNLLIM